MIMSSGNAMTVAGIDRKVGAREAHAGEVPVLVQGYTVKPQQRNQWGRFDARALAAFILNTDAANSAGTFLLQSA
jgi:hypothetical protein